MNPHQQLKITLQSHGALRPQAWLDIQLAMQPTKLRAGESLVRKEGDLCFLQAGLLKEYDPEQRRRPAIIAFIATGDFVHTRRHSQRRYLKAIVPCTIGQWSSGGLEQLHERYPELKNIYDALCAGYERHIAQRSILLELPPRQRLPAFREPNQRIIPYLTKKDIANHLSLSYSFVLHFRDTS